MLLRVHDDGRVALQTTAGDWLVFRSSVTSPHWMGALHEPGWHEAVVLTATDVDAGRLAEAWSEASVEVLGSGTPPQVRVARAVLDRLAAGTEGER